MEEICRIIENALGLKAGSVNINDNKDTIKFWDSLGLLSILSGLEEKYGNKVTTIEDLSKVKSVKEIIEVLKRESII